ncbi:hypothetical protein F5050DRAFT_1798982 [Lentinula boryana]|uniref:RING-type domain-containing protein n=1 Tax=Lentinula boryana TaxID=40481 RepID=A0ABQ8QGE5_9AGAR|nr:hypothetical protein F5050DRAFT_1798982 [Lentinula boryana]
MNSLTYVEVPNQNLVCCICRMPFVNPCTNQTCFHTFCRECIIQSLGHSPQCPIDRSNLQIEDIHPADPIIRSLVDELVVKCSNESVGCSYTCQRQFLDIHITTDCSYALVPCGAHRSSCTKKLYQCEDCNTEQPCSSRAVHASSCYAAMVKCSHEHHGCPWEGRRKDLPSHTKICAYEAIKGFFSVQDAQKATVVNQNNLLKQKVDILESQLRVAQFELCCAQRALGPWFQNPASRSTSVYPPHGQLLIPTQLNSSSSSRPYMSPDNQASITQYFPDIQPSPSTEVATRIHPPTPERPNFAPPSVQSQFPHAAPTQSWQSAGYPPTGTRPRSPQNIVAPLNLNATLKGSLEGLRESIVSLSTSLDSLGRRNEIALANETLRLNEEVMSLRAALHGLRMQVHTIMMDRNAQVTGRGPGIDPLFIQGDSQWLSSNPNRAHIMQNTLPNSITKL